MKKLLVLAIAIISILLVSCEKNDCIPDSKPGLHSYFSFNSPKIFTDSKSYSKADGDYIVIRDSVGNGLLWLVEKDANVPRFVSGFSAITKTKSSSKSGEGSALKIFDDGTVHSQWVSNKYAESFNSSNGWSFSYLAKVSIPSDPGGDGFLTFFDLESSPEEGGKASFMIRYSQDKIKLFIGDPDINVDTCYTSETTQDYISGQGWHQYTITSNYDTIKCYIDKNLVIEAVLDYHPSAPYKLFELTNPGGGVAGVSEVSMIIDELYFWDSPLTEADVIEHFNKFQ